MYEGCWNNILMKGGVVRYDLKPARWAGKKELLDTRSGRESLLDPQPGESRRAGTITFLGNYTQEAPEFSNTRSNT